MIKYCKALVSVVPIISVFILFCQNVNGVDFPQLNKLRSKTSEEDQRTAVEGLIQRVVGQRSSAFKITINSNIGPKNKDTFILKTEGNVLHINGSSGVAASMGFYHYLKYFCNAQYTWAGKQITIPTSLPQIKSPGLTVTTPDRFRYYQNVCTVSYSFVWWKWERWEREIDWMAMRGINLPLAFTGQEAMFQRVYMNMGFTMADLNQHFGGPAFLAWARMGNIQGWGGPLPQTWINEKLILQHKILTRMRQLGMIPVLPGFAGHVPSAITRLYPNAKVMKLGSWGKFNCTYSCTYLLDAGDPLFKQIGKALITEMSNEFGVDHIYNCDMFNEMRPKSGDPSYLANTTKAVYNSMKAADPDAVWLMQGWMFGDKFWTAERMEALLTSVPIGRMIILDLYAEINPIYRRSKSFYGQPFIWCMLQNFGGADELFGTLQSVNAGPPYARNQFPNSTMIGTGLTMEGINQNEMMYEFMTEHAWRNESRNTTQWMSQFATQRYGKHSSKLDKAWQLLKDSVYASMVSQSHLHDGFLKRPKLDMESHVWYEPEMLYQAWDQFIAEADNFNNTLFRYDLIDVTRNSLQILFIDYHKNLTAAFLSKDPAGVESHGAKLLQLLSDLDTLLGSDEHFLLGRWLNDAFLWATDAQESMLYQYNARTQITTWGPDAEIRDYAAKQWSGLIKGYYAPRWKLFAQTLYSSLINKQPFIQSEFVHNVFTLVEQKFIEATDDYPTDPVGDSVKLAKQVHKAYRSETRLSHHKKWEDNRDLKQEDFYPSYRTL